MVFSIWPMMGVDGRMVVLVVGNQQNMLGRFSKTNSAVSLISKYCFCS
jgi:hypothetical protein